MLILASRSPQRRAILAQLGIAFEVRAADVEELTDGEPAELAAENARRKASAAASSESDEVVLGADTVVELDGRIYGKPRDENEARATLESLAGRRHSVVSGLCLIERGGFVEATARTVVEFRSLDRRLIDWYLASGEWRERAGGYAVQGLGAALVLRVEGDYLNVVGLPVATLLDLRPELMLG